MVDGEWLETVFSLLDMEITDKQEGWSEPCSTELELETSVWTLFSLTYNEIIIDVCLYMR